MPRFPYEDPLRWFVVLLFSILACIIVGSLTFVLTQRIGLPDDLPSLAAMVAGLVAAALGFLVTLTGKKRQ